MSSSSLRPLCEHFRFLKFFFFIYSCRAYTNVFVQKVFSVFCFNVRRMENERKSYKRNTYRCVCVCTGEEGEGRTSPWTVSCRGAKIKTPKKTMLPPPSSYRCRVVAVSDTRVRTRRAIIIIWLQFHVWYSCCFARRPLRLWYIYIYIFLFFSIPIGSDVLKMRKKNHHPFRKPDCRRRTRKKNVSKINSFPVERAQKNPNFNEVLFKSKGWWFSACYVYVYCTPCV